MYIYIFLILDYNEDNDMYSLWQMMKYWWIMNT